MFIRTYIYVYTHIYVGKLKDKYFNGKRPIEICVYI